MAPAPRPPGLALEVIEEEKEDNGQATISKEPRRGQGATDVNAGSQGHALDQHMQPEEFGDLTKSHPLSQASYASRSPSKQDFNMGNFSTASEDTFVEDRDSKRKYRYIFYSPSIEIFNRMHQIFSTLPEIHQNIHEARAEKQDEHPARKPQRNFKQKKEKYSHY